MPATVLRGRSTHKAGQVDRDLREKVEDLTASAGAAR